MPIEPPTPDVLRSLARKIAEGFFGALPGGAMLTGIYSVTHPSQADQVVKNWQNKITDAVNNIDQIVAELIPTFRISDEAANLAVHLARACQYGHGREIFKPSDITGAIPGASDHELVELCGELASLDLISISAALGAEVARVRPLPSLFAVFDQIVSGNDPQHDAMVLAAFLAENESLNSVEYVKESGWPIRRYNPAMAIVCQMIDDRRISKMSPEEYYSRHCITTPQERAELRRFALPITRSNRNGN